MLIIKKINFGKNKIFFLITTFSKKIYLRATKKQWKDLLMIATTLKEC